MHADDRQLARRLLAGDERAFDEFFGSSFSGLYRFALFRVNHDPDAAEEVAQATLCRAISKLGTYRGEASLFTWLCTFCRHEISAFHARRGRHPAPVELIEERPEVAAALETLWALGGQGAEEALRRGEIARFVHLALDRLPARYAEGLEWKYMDGLSVNEIAERLALSPKATESMLTRAREAFRDAFTTLAREGFPGRGVPEVS